MKFLRSIVMKPRCAGCGRRHGLARLLGFGGEAMLALWVVAVLGFCVLGLAGAML